MTKRLYDLLVVGAGPAGCAAGIEAARAGARVCVVDRARFPRAKTCGDAVSNRASGEIDDLVGMPHALTSIPHARVGAAQAIFPDGSTVTREFGAAYGYIVPRFHLDDFLRRGLEAAGAELAEGLPVRRLLLDERSGNVRGVQTDRGVLEARMVVAADGPGSIAWTVLGRSYRRDASLAVAITAYMAGVTPHARIDASDHYFERDISCGYGWAFPAVDGAFNVGVYQRADAFHRHERTLLQMFERFLATHPESFASAELIGRPRVWALPLSSRLLPPAGRGILTAGDAGSLIDPLSGEGIWQALHSGRAAGRHAVVGLDRGGATATWARRYQWRCATEIAAVAMTRLGVQQALDWVVEHEIYRHQVVRSILERGYRAQMLEVAKQLH